MTDPLYVVARAALLGDQVAEAVHVLSDLQTRHPPSELALVFCQLIAMTISEKQRDRRSAGSWNGS